jgi:hypothetical protein
VQLEMCEAQDMMIAGIDHIALMQGGGGRPSM